jgi:hypothetical protein
VIASSAFFVLDAILDWPVANYDGSWSQWGQMSGSQANGGKLNADSPLRTDVPSRSELVVYNYDTTAGPVFYTAATGTAGLNDMTAGGTFTGTANRSFRVQIDGVGAIDTFSWIKSAPTQTIPDATLVPISAGTPITLTEGMTITFAASTGHTLGDRWDFITMRPVELLALDGSICSSSLSLTGAITFSPSGCTPFPPNSYASGNEIEDADAAYFGVGGGTGGGGGGGSPIAPGY